MLLHRGLIPPLLVQHELPRRTLLRVDRVGDASLILRVRRSHHLPRQLDELPLHPVADRHREQNRQHRSSSCANSATPHFGCLPSAVSGCVCRIIAHGSRLSSSVVCCLSSVARSLFFVLRVQLRQSNSPYAIGGSRWASSKAESPLRSMIN